jgi:hypothetical protein
VCTRARATVQGAPEALLQGNPEARQLGLVRGRVHVFAHHAQRALLGVEQTRHLGAKESQTHTQRKQRTKNTRYARARKESPPTPKKNIDEEKKKENTQHLNETIIVELKRHYKILKKKTG